MKILCSLFLFILSSNSFSGVITESKNAAKAISEATPIVTDAAKQAVNTLKSVSEESTKAAKEVNEAASQVREASTGVNQAATGVRAASKGVNQAAIGVETAAQEVNEAAAGVQTASLGVNEAATGVSQVSSSINELIPTIEKLLELTTLVLIIIMIVALIITVTFMIIGLQVSKMTHNFESTSNSLNKLIVSESKLIDDVKEIAHVGAVAAKTVQDNKVVNQAKNDYRTLMDIAEGVSKFNIIQYFRSGLKKKEKDIETSALILQKKTDSVQIISPNLQNAKKSA